MAAVMVAQLVAGQQQVLDRVVVQQLGQALALAVLGGRGPGRPAARARRRRRGCAARARRAAPRARPRRLPPTPGTARARRSRRRRRRVRVAGFGSEIEHVDRDRHARPCRGESRAQPERGHERKREERQPGLGIGAARGIGQSAERDQVDDGLDPRHAIQGRNAAGCLECVRHQQPYRPQSDQEQQGHEEVAVGPGVVDGALAERDQRNQGDAQQRHAELGARPLGAAVRGGARNAGGRPHSSSPRRIASATAAARSETSSFS